MDEKVVEEHVTPHSSAANLFTFPVIRLNKMGPDCYKEIDVFTGDIDRPHVQNIHIWIEADHICCTVSASFCYMQCSYTGKALIWRRTVIAMASKDWYSRVMESEELKGRSCSRHHPKRSARPNNLVKISMCCKIWWVFWSESPRRIHG